MNDLNEMEIKEGEDLLVNNDYNYLYPNLNDPNFIIKIAEKKEFNDTEYSGTIEDVQEHGDKLCNARFELANHQIFVRNFLSNQTPYNGLLLYHGLGTGKTCSAITISEEYREYMKQMGITKRIIIVGNKNIQDNYRLQLFDERNLELVDGIWRLTGCTGNKFINEIDPMRMKGISRNKIISQINTIINLSYLFLGYREFGNLIAKRINKFKTETDTKLKNKNIAKAIENEYSNRLIIIDEVQNIRMTDNVEDRKVGQRLLELTKYASNVKLLLLSATPMFNSYKEIIWLINLLNQNDKRPLIDIKDVFDAKGNFKEDSDGNEIGKQILTRKARGYISFVRGDNPYTFPYRIYPSVFSPPNGIIGKEYPKTQINGKTLLQGLEYIDVYLTEIGEYQKTIYNSITDEIKEKYINITEDKLDKGLGYQVLEGPLQILNITYPVEDIDNIKETYGKTGLENVMKFSNKYNDFEYKSTKFGNIFTNENIGKYSGKIKSICDNILVSEGIVLVYSQYIDGGVVPIALALEEMGFTRFGRDNLFKTAPIEQIDSLTMLPKSQVDKKLFTPARYSIISGDLVLSPNNIKEVKKLTNDENKLGKDVKVVIISRAGSEGIDFKNIRQVHIIDPWYNMNRIEQVIGRGVRTCSHKNLEFSYRNVMIFLYATNINDSNIETLDLYLYRLAEIKALKIGNVSRVLKKTAVDCILNKGQSNFTVENMNQTVKQILSNKLEIKWKVGDKPYTAVCDYLDKCEYECNPTKDITDLNYETYNEDFIMLNTDKIIEKIKDIFREKYVCDKAELIATVNNVKIYPLVQIYSALDKMIEDKTELLTDMIGKKGFLVNVGDYYMFQPIELKNSYISIFERVTPIDFKRQKITVSLPSNIDNVLDYKDIEKNNSDIIKEMEINFNKTVEPIDNERGVKDWYLLCSITIERMSNEGIDKNLLQQFVIDHMIESMNYVDKLTLLKDISNKKTLNDFENMIKRHFSNIIFEINDLIGAVFNNKGKLTILKLSNKEWLEAEPKDIMDMKNEIKALEIPNERLANIVGVIVQFKENEYVFKTMEVSKKRKGARCDQAGKAGVLDVLNKIVENKNYTMENSKKNNVIQLCSEQEFYLRYYNSIKKDDKYWFLSPEETIATKIEK